MSIPYIPKNAAEPYQVYYEVTSSSFDLTTVTSAVLSVRLPDGSETEWSADISMVPSPTTTSLTLIHDFTTGELQQVGTYVLQPLLTTPDGTLICDGVAIRVLRRHVIS
jgi:hypothetical protein